MKKHKAKKKPAKKPAKPQAVDEYTVMVRRASKAAQAIPDDLWDSNLREETFNKILDHLLAGKK